jgi:CheY-like chemotaxis protein
MGEQSTILVVEDQDAIGSVLADVLQEEGYVVVRVTHGAAALEYLRSNPAPLLVILDLNMPVMDGREFLLRRDDAPELKTAPVLVLSADHQHAQSYAKRYGTEYMVKPFKLDALLKVVARHAGQQASR